VRKLINLDIKKEMRESGKNSGDLSVEYGMAKSTINTILKTRNKKCTGHEGNL